MAAVRKGKLWVCSACGAKYFAPVNERCPSCKGAGEYKDVVWDESGVAKLAHEE